MEDNDVEQVAYTNDAYFKDVFSNPQRATVLFQEHLPAPIVSQLDWPSLTLVPGSFVKQSLQQLHSDLLFSVRIDSTPCLLYLLCEHQTTVDELMPLRLLGYIHEILRIHAKTHGCPLPPVLPLVVHQGPDRWTASTNLADLFALPESLREPMMPYVLKFQHALLDLSQFEPRQAGKDGELRVVLELMKRVREKRLLEFFRWLSGQAALPIELLRKSLLYAFYTEANLDLAEIATTLESNPELQEEIMSTAALLIAKGKAEGKAEGEAKGRLAGKLTCLQEMMRLPVSSDEELSALDTSELERRYKALQCQYDEQFKRS